MRIFGNISDKKKENKRVLRSEHRFPFLVLHRAMEYKQMGPTVVSCIHHFSQIYHFEYLFKVVLREIERCIDITVIYNDEKLAAIPHNAI